MGNRFADALAGVAAKRATLPAEVVREFVEARVLAWSIWCRLAAILVHCMDFDKATMPPRVAQYRAPSSRSSRWRRSWP
eukprot:8951317-Lingulodinium_polyedra.AAC.1